MIRLARSSDFPEIIRIESDSGRLFREIGLDAVANEAPPTPEQLSAYRRRGIVWVATEENDRPIAYLMAEQVDLRGHIDQVTVSPDFSRRGIGGAHRGSRKLDGRAASRRREFDDLLRRAVE